MKTQADVRNSLGDDISWKSLYAQQKGIYEEREQAIVDSILWCSAIKPRRIIELLQKELGG